MTGNSLEDRVGLIAVIAAFAAPTAIGAVIGLAFAALGFIHIGLAFGTAGLIAGCVCAALVARST